MQRISPANEQPRRKTVYGCDTSRDSGETRAAENPGTREHAPRQHWPSSKAAFLVRISRGTRKGNVTTRKGDGRQANSRLSQMVLFFFSRVIIWKREDERQAGRSQGCQAVLKPACWIYLKKVRWEAGSWSQICWIFFFSCAIIWKGDDANLAGSFWVPILLPGSFRFSAGL